MGETDPMAVFGQGGLNDHVDPDALLESIDVDEEELEFRKAFIGFDGEDERRLTDLEPLLRDHQDEIAERFYENLTSYDGPLEIMGRSPKGIEPLKQTQRAYLVSLATGEYDEAYFRNRARIGKLHELLDMPMKYYIGQYGVYYDLLLSTLDERVQQLTVDAIETWLDEELDGGRGSRGFVGQLLGGGDKGANSDGLDESLERAVRTAIHDGMADVLSVLKIMNLDMQIAADTYFESYTQKLDREVGQRRELASRVQRDVRQPIEDLQSASRATAESAQEINDHVVSQAQDMDEIAAEVESLSANVEAVATAAEAVQEAGGEAAALANDGVEQADSALEELTAVEDAAVETTDAVDRLESQMGAIDEVVDRIDQLAERTKVLGTNASVEATRGENAGETLQVIAKEVQSFAAQAQGDLDRIEAEIEEMKRTTDETVGAVDETVSRLSQSANRIDEAVADFRTIHDVVEEVSNGVDIVANAVTEQATSAEAINRTVEGAATSADRISSETQTVAVAAEQQTQNLTEIVQNVRRLATVESVERRPIYER